MCSKPILCTVCLKSDSKLIAASQTDSNNVKWSCKLEFCVPEVEWDEDCSLCCVCMEQLDAACSFRNLCLQSNGLHIQLANWQLLDKSNKKSYTNKTNSKQKIDFTCYICSKTFLLKSSLIKHVETHSLNRCDLCKEQFTTSTQLQLHNVQVHSETTKEDPSECRFCSRDFKSPISLNQHIRRMHRNEFSNFDNTSTPDNKANIKIQIVDSNNSPKVEEYGDDMNTANICYISEEKFKTDNNYDSFNNDFDNECFTPEDNSTLEQDNNVHPTYESSNINATSEHSNINPTSECSKINPTSDSATGLKNKNKTETKSRNNTRSRAKFFCEECKNVFVSSKKLLDHVVSEHGFDPSIIKPFGCDKCDSKFSSSSNLLQHKKYHIGKRTHICTFCGKGYITKSDLNTHEKQHLNKREYQCVGCPKTFNTHKDLRSHRLVVHTDPSLWNYVCTFCQKRFPIKSNLDQHMRRHTGEKRFGCHICEKRFVDKIVMQKHIKSHSNFRAFKCEHCEKEYKDCKVLEIHLTKVHGIGNAKIPVRVKKHFCHVCPKSYFAKNKLTRHMFSHTGEKPYVCHICERKFTDKSYVKQHLKTTHNVFDVIDENK